MEELSGLVSGLSGRVDTLYNTYTYINQQLLQRPDLTNFSAYKTIWNSQVQTLSDSVSRLQNSVAVLQNLLINLTLTSDSNYSSFTGYTGVGVSSEDLTSINRSLTIVSPQEDDEATIIRLNREYTLQSVYSVIDGTTGSSVLWNIYTDSSRLATGIGITNSITTSNNSEGTYITSFSNSSFNSGDFMWLVITGVQGVVNELFLSLTLN